MIDPTGRSHAQNFNNRHQTTKHIVMKKTTINTRNSSTTNNSSNPKTPTMKMSIANNKKSSTTKGSQNQKPQNKTKMKKQTPVTPVKESTTKQFTYERKFVNPLDLKIHPLLNVIGFEQPDNFFTEHANHFNYLERSVITEDMFAITHPTDVLAAQQLNKDKIEVVIMKGATIHDVIKFISFKDVWQHGKSRKKIFDMITFLTDHLTQTVEGKAWAKELNGKKTRQKVAGVMNVSDGTVKNVSRIGKNDPEMLDKIDNGEMTSTDAKEQIVSEQPFESRKCFRKLKFTDKIENIKDEPKDKIRSISIDFEQAGELKYTIDGSKVKGTLGGLPLNSAFHSVEADNENNGKREDSQHHVIVPFDHKYSVHIIIRNLDGLCEEIRLAA